MHISLMTALQILLLIWLLSILITSIFEILKREPPSTLFLGLCLIVLGTLWVLSLKLSFNLKPWLGSFYVSGFFGILLITGGIKILLKPPLRSWITGILIFVLVFLLFAYGPSKKNNSSFVDFLDQITSRKLWNSDWLQDSK